MTDRLSTENEQARAFVLCADDYAISPAVSGGILELLAASRLTATGAMTNRPAWRGWAGALAPYADRADLGVHLNLTCGAPLGPMPLLAPEGALPALGPVIRAAQSRRGRAEIAQEIERQLDAFESAAGRPPDFVDGHQHVHAMPGIGAALIAILARRYGSRRRFYVRDPADRIAAILRRPASAKAMIVLALAAGFGARARAAGLRTNRGFSGFSAFAPVGDYGAELTGALHGLGAAHLAMCHPGRVDAELRSADSVVDTRPRELAFLAGDGFSELLSARHLRLGRMSDMLGA
ncbi:MAG: hypothetical protein BGP06_16155 [Rhizobiales bacterium 65-9]|nr:ChbG/HpnK family deacetylase [Hyphomicrobiales bacterium]OJY37998.1 MAG: hypothetical protein BGP06_16155 [Rhizobiales bacterium 65-9]